MDWVQMWYPHSSSAQSNMSGHCEVEWRGVPTDMMSAKAPLPVQSMPVVSQAAQRSK
jgi:hypothetical protein